MGSPYKTVTENSEKGLATFKNKRAIFRSKIKRIVTLQIIHNDHIQQSRVGFKSFAPYWDLSRNRN